MVNDDVSTAHALVTPTDVWRDMKQSRLPRVLRRALGYVRFARRHVHASAASLFLVNESDGIVRGIVSEWDWTRTSFSSNLHDWPSVERALVVGNALQISAKEARGTEAVWFERQGIVRTVCVPLRVADRRLGVLFFDFNAESEGEPDTAFLSDVGRRCARALERHLETIAG